MKNFLFSNCILIQNRLFSEGILGGIPVLMDLDSGIIDVCSLGNRFVFSIKNTVVDFFDSFENKVYALDSGEDQLVIWDLEKKSCHAVFLGCSHKTWINFAALERVEQNYYIFPKYENRVLIYHIDTNEITETLGDWEIKEIQCTCRVNNSVWILPKDSDVMYCYDLDERKSKVYNLKKMIRNCVHAIYHDGCIYILNMCGEIYQWDIDKTVLRVITCLETISNEIEYMSRIVYAGNKLILLPAYGENIYIVDMTTGQAEIYRAYPDDFYYYHTGWLKYYGYCENKEYYYFALCAGNYLLKIEKISGELIWIKPKIDLLGGRIIDHMMDKVICESKLELADLFHIKPVNRSASNKKYFGKEIYNRIGEIL